MKKKKTDRPEDLLCRKAGVSYRREWKDILLKQKEEKKRETISCLVFRLQNEWFALYTSVFKEVQECRSVHSVPQKNHPVFRGLVNIRGRLRLTVSFHELLGLQDEWSNYCQFVVIKQESRLWVFRTDEIQGVQHIEKDQIESVPGTSQLHKENFVKGVIRIGEQRVSLLDPELIFEALEKVLE